MSFQNPIRSEKRFESLRVQRMLAGFEMRSCWDAFMVAQKQSLDQSNLVGQLRNKIRSVETSNRIGGQARVSSGCAAVDRLLPDSGYQRGTLVQWLTGGGQAADYLSLLTAKQAAADGGAIVVFDPENQFYPPAVGAIGINLNNLIILKASKLDSRDSFRGNERNRELDSDLLWSIDQALRCPAVAAVWGPINRIGERWFRRFQLSAESSGCLGLFVQPIAQARQPSWSEVQWLVGRAPESLNSQQDSEQIVRLQLTRCRGTQTGKAINLSINTITGNVQHARRDHEQQPEPQRGKPARRPFGTGQTDSAEKLKALCSSSKNTLHLASQLADPKAGRRKA